MGRWTYPLCLQNILRCISVPWRDNPWRHCSGHTAGTAMVLLALATQRGGTAPTGCSTGQNATSSQHRGWPMPSARGTNQGQGSSNDSQTGLPEPCQPGRGRGQEELWVAGKSSNTFTCNCLSATQTALGFPSWTHTPELTHLKTLAKRKSPVQLAVCDSTMPTERKTLFWKSNKNVNHIPSKL